MRIVVQREHGAIDVLEDFRRHVLLSSSPLDSFAVVASKQTILFDVESDCTKGYRAIVHLCRVGVGGESVKSDWQPTEASAKQHAALQAVRVLHKLNFINHNYVVKFLFVILQMYTFISFSFYNQKLAGIGASILRVEENKH